MSNRHEITVVITTLGRNHEGKLVVGTFSILCTDNQRWQDLSPSFRDCPEVPVIYIHNKIFKF